MIEQNFKENEIPYQEFAKLGYTREMISELSRKDLEQLLSGRRTSLLPITHIEGQDKEFDIKAKFSLKRNNDGTVSLIVHPVRESIDNDIKLSVHELNKVKAFLNGIDNLYCIGRNGQHRYNNMDHSTLAAMKTVDCILGQIDDREDIWSVNTESDYHEEKQAA